MKGMVKALLRGLTAKKYVGAFRNGVRHGQGTYTWNNGNTYVGAYHYGERQGQGTFTYADGQYEVGEWKKGKLNGFATAYNADGSIYKQGIWKDDEFQYSGEPPTQIATNNTAPKYSWLNQLNDNDLCSIAINSYPKKTWRNGKAKDHVAEAKRRGLDCGVEEGNTAKIVSSASENANYHLRNATQELVCYNSTWKGSKGLNWHLTVNQSWVEEAKRRGLDCGVEEGNTAKIVSSASENANYHLRNATQELVCYNSTWKGSKGLNWHLTVNQSWVEEAKRRGLDCGVNNIKSTQVATNNTPTVSSQELELERQKREQLEARLAH